MVSGPYLAEKGTCTISIWLRDQNYGGNKVWKRHKSYAIPNWCQK